MTSSSDPRDQARDQARDRARDPGREPGIVPDTGVTALPVPELRSGHWTRLGSSELLGDAVTEMALNGLAEAARNAAQTQGYAAGWAEGRREAAEAARRRAEDDARARAEAEARREEEHRTAIAALEAAAAGLAEGVTEVCARVEDQASRLAIELVTVLLGHELRVESAADVVARVLEVLPAGPAAEVRLHPTHAAAAACAELRGHGARVVADPTLAIGDAVVEASDHVVDLRLEDALARLDKALGASHPTRSHLSAVRP